MGQLIDDLLAFSRAGRAELHRAPIDMTALARAAYAQTTTVAERERGHLDLEPLPAAVGDPALIRQVWANLLANAVKYSAPRESPRIHVFASCEGELVRYHVEDNGVGFDMTYADKLFGVFQRLHSSREFPGTGVGLALVRRLVSRHGGTTTAHGAVGEGATFTFTIPAAEEA